MKQVDLSLADSFIERKKHVGLAQIAFVLGDLVLPDEMISEGVPGEFSEQAVILMGVVATVGKYEVRLDLRRDAMNEIFNLRPLGWEVSVAEVTANYLSLAGSRQPSGRTALRLPARTGLPLSTTHQTSISGCSSNRRSTLPPQPISMSSAWQPRHSTRRRFWRTGVNMAVTSAASGLPVQSMRSTRSIREPLVRTAPLWKRVR